MRLLMNLKSIHPKRFIVQIQMRKKKAQKRWQLRRTKKEHIKKVQNLILQQLGKQSRVQIISKSNEVHQQKEVIQRLPRQRIDNKYK